MQTKLTQTVPLYRKVFVPPHSSLSHYLSPSLSLCLFTSYTIKYPAYELLYSMYAELHRLQNSNLVSIQMYTRAYQSVSSHGEFIHQTGKYRRICCFSWASFFRYSEYRHNGYPKNRKIEYQISTDDHDVSKTSLRCLRLKYIEWAHFFKIVPRICPDREI